MYPSPCQPPSSLNLRLDDALFQRLVESRWDAEQESAVSSNDSSSSGNGGKARGVDLDGFARIYRGAATPATAFGRHLRKAAGRGEEDLGEIEIDIDIEIDMTGDKKKTKPREGFWLSWSRGWQEGSRKKAFGRGGGVSGAAAGGGGGAGRGRGRGRV